MECERKRCEKCGVYFSERQYYRHKKGPCSRSLKLRKPASIPKIECQECQLEFKSSAQLATHQKETHGVQTKTEGMSLLLHLS